MMIQSHQLRQELRQEQKLELSMQQQLLQLVPSEFRDLIGIEEDMDIGLLKESLSFLVLHEICHPLHERGDVYVPAVDVDLYVQNGVTAAKQNAIEVGIDKAAFLVGQSIGIDYESMVESHLAICQRVLRDISVRKFDDSLLARLTGEITVNIRQGTVHKRELQKFLDGMWKHMPDYCQGDLMGRYIEVYANTKLNKEASPKDVREGYAKLVANL